MPAISRHIIDLAATGHGCDSTAGVFASQYSVFANGVNNPVLRFSDRLMPHTIIFCTPDGCSCISHDAIVKGGSSTVFAEGVPVARVGDSADRGAMIQGSPNVFAGG